MSSPLRKPEPEPVLDLDDREILELEDYFSLVADRQDDYDLPYYPSERDDPYVHV